MRFLLSIIPCILPLLSWGQSSMEKHIPFRDIEATDSGIVVTYTFCGCIHQPDPLHDDPRPSTSNKPTHGILSQYLSKERRHTVIQGARISKGSDLACAVQLPDRNSTSVFKNQISG